MRMRSWRAVRGWRGGEAAGVREDADGLFARRVPDGLDYVKFL